MASDEYIETAQWSIGVMGVFTNGIHLAVKCRVRKYLVYGLAMLWFIAISVCFTWPLLLEIDSRYFARRSIDDISHFLWNMWWIRTAISLGANPLWSHYIFYPTGVSLAYHVLTLPQSLLGALLMDPARLPVAFNVVFLLSVILSGWFAALLLKQLTDSWIGAIGGATYFVLVPNFVSHMGFGDINLISWQWLMAAGLLLRVGISNLLEASRVRQLVLWLGLGVTEALMLYSDLQYGVFFAFVLPVLLSEVPGRILLLCWRRLIVLFSMSAAVATLVAYPLIRGLVDGYESVTASAPWVASVDVLVGNSGDVAGFMLPRAGSDGGFLLWDRLLGGVPPSGFEPGPESKVYLGLVALAVSAVGALKCRKVVPLAVLTVGALLSVGPIIRFLDNELTPNWLFIAVHNLPLLVASRTPARFIFISAFAISVLVAYGLAWISRHTGRYGIYLGCIVIIFMMTDLAYLPNLKDPAPGPSRHLVAAMTSQGPGTVMEVPRFGLYSLYRMVYHQVFHEMPIVSGYVTRPQSPNLTGTEILDAQVGLSSLRMFSSDYESFLWGIGNNRSSEFEQRARWLRRVFGYFDLKYILVDKSLFSESKLQRIDGILIGLLGSKRLAEDKGFVVYQVQPLACDVCVDYGELWLAWEDAGWTTFRWSSGLSSLYLLARTDSYVSLEFPVWSHGDQRRLTIVLDGKGVGQWTIAPEVPTRVTIKAYVKAGLHRLILETDGHPTRETNGSRLLSFAVGAPSVEDLGGSR